MESKKVSPFLFVALGVAVGLLGFFLILANPFGWKISLPGLPINTSTVVNKNDKKDSNPKGTASAPTPQLILPHGTQTFNASGSDKNKAKVTSITYDPIDPAKNTSQTVIAKITSREPIKSVSISLHTDNQTTDHLMTLSSGTSAEGTWATTFVASDTYEKIYNVTFNIITELGNKISQPMYLR